MSRLIENGTILAVYLGMIAAIIILFALAYWLWKCIPTTKAEKERDDKITSAESGVPKEKSAFDYENED